MIKNMKQLEKAIAIALKAHQNQIDKGGKVYILHPLRIMLQMPTEELQIIAILHDVVEDSNYTFDNLKKEGFSVRIIKALQALTKQDNEQYEDFIKRVKNNTLATKVKIADIKDNSNIKRIKNPKIKDLERIKKYKKALKMLNK